MMKFSDCDLCDGTGEVNCCYQSGLDERTWKKSPCPKCLYRSDLKMDEKYEVDTELQTYEHVCGKILQLQRDRASCYRAIERIDKELKALKETRGKIGDKYINEKE